MLSRFASFFVLFLGIFFAVNAQENANYFLNEWDDCQAVQAFPNGRNFYYTYEGTVVHQSSSREEPNGFRVKCSRVVINVLANCAARLKLEGCALLNGQMQDGANGLSFTEDSSKTSKINHFLHRFYSYFYFNSGKITHVFMHEDEPLDTRNLKKAILSALSLKFMGQGFRHTAEETFTIRNQSSILGIGDVNARVTWRSGAMSNVTTHRDLTEQKNPRKIHNSVLRLRGFSHSNTQASRFLAPKLQGLLHKYMGSSFTKQSCQYTLYRHRRIDAVTCTDSYSVPVLDKMKQIQYGQQTQNYMSTNVTIQLSSYRIATPKANDGMSERERRNFQSSYKQTDMIFESDVVGTDLHNFDAFDAYNALIDSDTAHVAPVFTNLVMWMSRQDDATITALYQQIMASFRDRIQQEPKILSTWLQLMSECMKEHWCDDVSHCAHGCQTAFSDFLVTGDVSSLNPFVQLRILEVISEIEYPNSAVLQAAKSFAATSPQAFLTFGKVLTRHASLPASAKSDFIIEESIEYLQNILRQNCPLTSDSNKHKEVEYAIRSLSQFTDSKRSITESVLSCTHGHSVPSSVLIAAIQVLNNHLSASMTKVRRRLSSFVNDERQLSDIRLSSAVLLLSNEPSESEISSVLQAIRSSENFAFSQMLKNFIKTQIFLSNVNQSSFTNSTVSSLISILPIVLGSESNSMIAESSSKTFERQQSLTLPIFEQAINTKAKAKLYFAGPNPAPFKIDLSFQIEVDSDWTTLIEAEIDTWKIKPITDHFLGLDGYLPNDVMKYLLSIPIIELLQPKNTKPPPLSTQGLKKLELIKDQFRLSQRVSDLSKSPIFRLEVLGKPIHLSNFFDLSFLNEISISKLLSIAELLENGFEMTTGYLFAEGSFHSQVPTSLGISLVTDVAWTNWLNSSGGVQLPLKKLFSTGHGNMTIGVHAMHQIFQTIERTMKAPLSDYTGAGVVVQVGVDSEVGFKVEKTPEKLNFSYESQTDNSIINIKVRPLTIPRSTSTGFQLQTTEVQRCRRNAVQESLFGRSLYYINCWDGGISGQIGLWFDLPEQPATIEFSWGPKLTEHNDLEVPSYSFNTSLSTTVLNRKYKSKYSIQYLPSHNTIRLLVFQNDLHQWTLSANCLQHYVGSDIDSVFVSVNSTAPNVEREVSAKLLVKRINQYSEAAGQRFPGFESELSHGVGPGYAVSGGLSINPRLQFDIVGRILRTSASQQQSGAAKIFFNQGPSPLPIMTLLYEKGTKIVNGLQHSVVEIAAKDINVFYIPYKNLTMSMMWFNETQQAYSKILKFESMIADQLPGPFLDLRQGTTFRSSEDRSNYDWNATITSSFFQGQWRTDATNEDSFTIESRILIPDEPIQAENIRSVHYEDIKLSVDAEDVTVYGVDVAFGRNPHGHSNTTLFVISNGNKDYVHISRNYVDCDGCFSIDVNSRQFRSQFGFSILPNRLHSSMLLNLSPALGTELAVYNIPSTSAFQDGLNVGYLIDVGIADGNVTGTAGLRSGNLHCSSNFGLVWDPNTPANYQSHDATMKSACYDHYSDESIFDFSMGFSYVSEEENGQRARNIFYNHSVGPSSLTFAENFQIQMITNTQHLQQLSISRNSSYAVEGTDVKPALDKHASSRISISREEYNGGQWSHPTYASVAKGTIPSLKKLPGASDLNYDHSGLYFLDGVDEETNPFVDLCNSRAECIANYQQNLEAAINDSYRTFSRLLDYVANEHQNFVDVPWRILQDYSLGDFDIFEISRIKNLGKHFVDSLQKLLTLYQGNMMQVADKFDLDESFAQMKLYFKMLSEMRTEDDYDLTSSKVYIEGLFKQIFEFDLALASSLQNPTKLPSQMTRLKNHILSLAALSKQDAEIFKTFGISNPDSCHFVTVNKHLHHFPSFPNPQCSWLGTTDTNDGVLSVLFSRAGLAIYFLDESLSQLSNGSFLFTDAEGVSTVLEYPFATKKCFCALTSENEVECSNFFTNIKLSFNPQDQEQFYYVETQGKSVSSTLKGLCGVPQDEDVPDRWLPDGESASNEAEFLNGYELTGLTECQFEQESFENLLSAAESRQLCEEAFAGFDSISSQAEEKENLMRACATRASTRQDACRYADLFAHSLRRSGIEISSTALCLPCLAGNSVRLESVNLMLVICRSVDMPPESTRSTIIELLQSSLQTLRSEGFSDVTVSLVTFGGPLEFYEPALNTIDGQIASSEETAVERRIREMGFEGPAYHSSVTARALEFITKEVNVEYKGVFSHVVLFAPETDANSVDGRLGSETSGLLASSFRSFFVVGMLDEEECNDRYVINPQLQDVCYSGLNFSQVVDEIQKATTRNLNQDLSCLCNEDAKSGRIHYRCESNEP